MDLSVAFEMNWLVNNSFSSCGWWNFFLVVISAQLYRPIPHPQPRLPWPEPPPPKSSVQSTEIATFLAPKFSKPISKSAAAKICFLPASDPTLPARAAAANVQPLFLDFFVATAPSCFRATLFRCWHCPMISTRRLHVVLSNLFGVIIVY